MRSPWYVQIRPGFNSILPPTDPAWIQSAPILASMLAFVTYSLTHSNLQAANIFSSLALFYGLRNPLNMLPMVIAQSIDAWVSLGRIQGYLLAEEEQEKRKIDERQEHAFDLVNASFTWETPAKPESVKHEDTTNVPPAGNRGQAVDLEKALCDRSQNGRKYENRETFHFEQMTLAISRRELLAVVGGVGSGKSSFLAALAGDMRTTSGTIAQGASMAYCPQYAWIQNASVRENIIFGRPFDQEWYHRVVEACCLTLDFDMLPDGDATEVGERGITLSGGQKQRLNIARAIYFNAQIVLLDDPLSAVDAQIGRHIFSEAICGVLKDKCRVLATHQLHVLSQCDRIIWMQHGKIEAIGTYNELLANNPEFTQMLTITAKHGLEKGDQSAEPAEKLVEDVVESIPQAVETAKPVLKGAELMQREEKGEKGIRWPVYLAYLRAAGGIFMAPLALLFLCLAQASNIMSTVWLSYWTSDSLSVSNGIYVSARFILIFQMSMKLKN